MCAIQELIVHSFDEDRYPILGQFGELTGREAVVFVLFHGVAASSVAWS